MKKELCLLKAELCVAIVKQQYEGRSKPRGVTVENKAVKLMGQQGNELLKLAKQWKVRVPKELRAFLVKDND